MIIDDPRNEELFCAVENPRRYRMKFKDIFERSGLRCAGGQSGRNSGYCYGSRTIPR
jgi:hypothetical protein